MVFPVVLHLCFSVALDFSVFMLSDILDVGKLSRLQNVCKGFEADGNAGMGHLTKAGTN